MRLAGPERPAYFLYHSLWYALDWLFPPSCGGCSRTGVRWCEDCQEQLARVAGPVCARCGEPLALEQRRAAAPSTELLCRGCAADPPEYQAVRSYAFFSGPLREAMHGLKYKSNIGIGEALSKHLIEIYNDLRWEVDLVTPVPLSAKRARERGYNQSGTLAKPLAYAIQKSYQPGALRRLRDTRTQVGLRANERKQNVEGAFTADEKRVKGKVVLVIDDVMTTGSTISACARALRKAGASAVYGLTLARALGLADGKTGGASRDAGASGDSASTDAGASSDAGASDPADSKNPTNAAHQPTISY